MPEAADFGKVDTWIGEAPLRATVARLPGSDVMVLQLHHPETDDPAMLLLVAHAIDGWRTFDLVNGQWLDAGHGPEPTMEGAIDGIYSAVVEYRGRASILIRRHE